MTVTSVIDNTNLDQSASAVDPIALAADIVAAYVSKNSLPAAELAGLIANVHHAIVGLGGAGAAASAPVAAEIEKPTPSQIRKSITPDAIISFIDGKGYKTMKRHLGTYGLDPHSYRQRYDLPSDYPMVAPNYSEQRSALAKTIGLGRPGGMARSADAATAEPKKRVRKAA